MSSRRRPPGSPLARVPSLAGSAPRCGTTGRCERRRECRNAPPRDPKCGGSRAAPRAERAAPRHRRPAAWAPLHPPACRGRSFPRSRRTWRCLDARPGPLPPGSRRDLRKPGTGTPLPRGPRSPPHPGARQCGRPHVPPRLRRRDAAGGSSSRRCGDGLRSSGDLQLPSLVSYHETFVNMPAVHTRAVLL